MPISLDTFILDGTSRTTDEIFVTVLGDVVLINDFKININALKISSLKEYIWLKKNNKFSINDADNMNLWKVDVGKDKLKDVDTEEKIRGKLRGEKMIAGNLFTDYFKVDQPVDRNVHIIIAISTTGKCLIIFYTRKRLKISAAPILRNIMLSRIHRPIIKHSSPIDTTNIDPEWLLARTIEPSEYAFQAKFLGIFKQLISTAYTHLDYHVLSEIREYVEEGQRHQRLNILIHDKDLPIYGFELSVAASYNVFDNHLKRSHNYCCVHECNKMYTINICPNNKLRNYFGKEKYNVIPIHVIYDMKDESSVHHVSSPDFKNEAARKCIYGLLYQLNQKLCNY
ncbi:hypothetical protein C1646_667162 [Rhizophagus diaphanus]|nr:hypothetical protein C1646_667162 [Rhizophagus diaphanus] [Rhizophagus sp. MUCL 43196]